MHRVGWLKLIKRHPGQRTRANTPAYLPHPRRKPHNRPDNSCFDMFSVIIWPKPSQSFGERPNCERPGHETPQSPVLFDRQLSLEQFGAVSDIQRTEVRSSENAGRQWLSDVDRGQNSTWPSGRIENLDTKRTRDIPTADAVNRHSIAL